MLELPKSDARVEMRKVCRSRIFSKVSERERERERENAKKMKKRN